MQSSPSTHSEQNPDVVESINALLPQTQCTKCGYQGCKPYAQAIAHDNAPINRCPPGGDEGIIKLAALLGRPTLPLDQTCGQQGPRRIARIEQEHCIGCTLCIVACPVDAIVGAPKRMHQVIEADCTGCDLCVAPCPVDCIVMEPASKCGLNEDWTAQQATDSRLRYELRLTRLAEQKEQNEQRLAQKALHAAEHLEDHVKPDTEEQMQHKRAVIQAALERARARRQKPTV